MKSGILKKENKGLTLASFFVLAGMFSFLGGAILTGTAKGDRARIENEYLAKNTEIVYHIQKYDMLELEKQYELGELTFDEYSDRLEEVKSEKYIEEKTEELMNADEDYKNKVKNVELDRKIGLGAVGVGGATLVAGAAIGGVKLMREGSEEKEQMIFFDDVKAGGEPPKDKTEEGANKKEGEVEKQGELESVEIAEPVIGERE